MYSGCTDIFRNTLLYCEFVTRMNDLKWYEFIKRSVLKEQINYYYPLMKNEIDTYFNRNGYISR